MAFEKEVTKFYQGLLRVFGKAVSSREMYLLGQEAMLIIRRRTRLGYGVKKMGSVKQRLSSMKPHSDAYKDIRLSLKARLYHETTPATQNLTFSGQMLNSLNIRKASEGKVTIGFPHEAHRASDGEYVDDIAEHQTKVGRVFMNLSKAELNQLRRFYRQKFGDLVKKQLP